MSQTYKCFVICVINFISNDKSMSQSEKGVGLTATNNPPFKDYKYKYTNTHTHEHIINSVRALNMTFGKG